MELRQLRHFLALAELGSFTGAAGREHIVQSGLSNSVHALESELDAELYARGSRPVRLTPAGQALVEPARRALAAAQAAREAVHDIENVVTGQLRIGVVRSALRLVPFADYVAEFAAGHPAVDVHLLQVPALAMLGMVGAGELDCGLVTAVPAAVAGVRLITLASDRLVLVSRDDHRLAHASGVRLADLAGERFVDVHSQWSARVMVDAAFRGRGRDPPGELRGERMGTVPRAGRGRPRDRLPSRGAGPGGGGLRHVPAAHRDGGGPGTPAAHSARVAARR